MEGAKAAAAVSSARQWHAAAALSAVLCLILVGMQAQPLGLSLRLLAVPTTVSRRAFKWSYRWRSPAAAPLPKGAWREPPTANRWLTRVPLFSWAWCSASLCATTRAIRGQQGRPEGTRLRGL